MSGKVFQPVRDKRLKPCPFCGEQPVIENHGQYSVVCDSEKCTVAPMTADGYRTKLAAIKAWNTRA